MSNTSWLQNILDNMNTIALIFPDHPSYSEKRAVREYFNAIPFLIPCSQYRTIFDTIIFQTSPIDPHVSNRTTLCEWVLKVTDEINKAFL